jgi:NADPH:quinone reductase-like Zn-dependent oxidoreductase
MSLPSTQQQFELARKERGFRLQLNEKAAVRQPGEHEVLVRVRATSLNHRDLAITQGFYPVGSSEHLVPLSDGAGDVVAMGPKARRFKLGDRVVGIFFQQWLQGRPTAGVGRSALGGAIDGMLAQYVTLHEDGLVSVPHSLSYEQAATLPCAAVTAWSGLMRCGRLQAGDTVLIQGTGGVSIFGLQRRAQRPTSPAPAMPSCSWPAASARRVSSITTRRPTGTRRYAS